MGRNAKSNLPARTVSSGSWRCDSKKQYLCLRDAICAADSYMDRIAMTRAPMMPYYCPRHLCWHTGHNTRVPMELAAPYSRHCAARERLRKEIAFLSGFVVGMTDPANVSRHGYGLD